METKQIIPIKVRDDVSQIIVIEGGNNYDLLDTSNGSEVRRLGNTTTNPDLELLGTGLFTIGGSQELPGGSYLGLGSASARHYYAAGVIGAIGADFGVGTIAPDGLMHVKAAASGATVDASADDSIIESNVAVGLSLLTTDANDCNLYMGSASDARGAYLKYNHDTALMQIGTDLASGELRLLSGTSNATMQLISTGDVGIGFSPSYKLDVNGTGRFTGQLNADADIVLTGSTGSLVLQNGGTIDFDDSGGSPQTVLQVSSGDDIIFGNANLDDITLAAGIGHSIHIRDGYNTNITIAPTAITLHENTTIEGNLTVTDTSVPALYVDILQKKVALGHTDTTEARLHIKGHSTDESAFILERNNTNAYPPRLYFKSSGGVVGAPLQEMSGWENGQIHWEAYTDTGTWVQGAYQKIIAEEDIQAASHGMSMRFAVVDVGGSTLNEKLIIDSDGVKIGVGANRTRIENDGTMVAEGNATTFEDINFSIGQLRSGGTRPSFIDKRGTGIFQDSFGVGEEVSGAVEPPHGAKLLAAMTPHIHITADGGDTTGNCRFQMIFKIGPYDGTEWTASTTVISTGDIAISAAWEKISANFLAVINNLNTIEGQVELTISRVAALSDEWGGEIFASTWGLHVEKDMSGSRQIGTK